MDENILKEVDKLLSTEPTEMEKMLAILDIEHSIVIDNNIGLIGEFRKDRGHKLSNRLMYLGDTGEKRGDYFVVIGEYGEILIEEKIHKTFLIREQGKPVTKYLFTLYDTAMKNTVDAFLDDIEVYSHIIVMYDAITGDIRTNCESLNYKYDRNIQLVSSYCEQGYQFYDNENEYTSYMIDCMNSIFILTQVN